MGLISPELQVVHNELTGISDELTKTSLSLALAKMNLESLAGKKVVHVGAGYGNCMIQSYLFGARDVIGIEADDEYRQLGVKMWTENEEVLRAVLDGDELFSKTTKYLGKETTDRMIKNILFKYKYIQRVASGSSVPFDIKVCRVGKDSVLNAVGQPADLIVATMVAPWLVAGGVNIPEMLRIFSEALVPGGMMVFNVPLFLLDLGGTFEEDCMRGQGIHDTEFYRFFIAELKNILKTEISFDSPNWYGHRKVKTMAVSDSCVRRGIDGVRLVGSQWQYFAPAVPISSALAVLGIYETAIETRKPAKDIAEFVFGALNCIPGRVPTLKDLPGFWVMHYVLKKD